MLVLCTAAVGAIYAGAYLYTEPAASATGTLGSVSSGAVATNSPGATAPSAGSSSGTPSSNASSSSSNSATKSSAAYKDGTYTGSAFNVYGSLSVSVQIAGGKITSVQITSYNMHYPAAYISPYMNDEVIKKQAVIGIYGVSGATASSYNFADAVYNALQKAKA